MPPEEILCAPVGRVLARGDLMMVARDAEAAIGIVSESKTEKHVLRHESELFSEALQAFCGTASAMEHKSDSSWARIDAYNNAGVVVRLCWLMGIRLDSPPDVDITTFHARALDELLAARETRAGEEFDRDLYRGRTIRYRAVRDLRLNGDYEAAIHLADQNDKKFVGTGADIYRPHYQYESTAARLRSGQAAEALQLLEQTEREYWTALATSRFISRYLVDYAVALCAWSEGDLDTASRRLAKSQQYLRRTGKHDAKYDIDDLLLALARADLLVAAGDRSLSMVSRTVDHLDSALRATERIRGRWRVISRSSSPLAAAFRRIYGDLARAAAELPGRQAAELGLRVALSAKQSGYAERIRADRSDVDEAWRRGPTGRSLRKLIEDAVRIESEQLLGGAATTTVGELDDVRQRIAEAVSPMLADTVLPVPPTAARVIDAVGDRYALDYVGLPDTVTGETMWFRTLIEPSGAMSFCQLAGREELSTFVAKAQSPTARLTDIMSTGLDWQALAEELLPQRLRDVLASATDEEPITLVISAHSALSLMPWAALRLRGRTRLVHRAVITQTPVLTCLSGRGTVAATGPALIQLVAGPGGVNVEEEAAAWGIGVRADGHVPLSECALADEASPVDVRGTFAGALASEDGRWRIAHVASHGSGTGLGQTLELPDAPVSAARALTMPWPPSLLMASCHVGRLLNIEHAEPLNFVMAVLAGGGECVVACIDEVNDAFAGQIAADIVRECQKGGVGLDAALRTAQLECAGMPETTWALFTAYSR